MDLELRRMIPETIMVRIDPGEHAFRACAIRLGHGDPWHVFVAAGSADRNLTPFESEFIPHEFTVEAAPGQDESMLAKLIVLFGRPWQEVLEDPTEVIGFHARVLDTLDDDMLLRIANTQLEVLESWAGEANYVHEGELLRAQITHDDALCLRN